MFFNIINLKYCWEFNGTWAGVIINYIVLVSIFIILLYKDKHGFIYFSILRVENEAIVTKQRNYCIQVKNRLDCKSHNKPHNKHNKLNTIVFNTISSRYWDFKVFKEERLNYLLFNWKRNYS